MTWLDQITLLLYILFAHAFGSSGTAINRLGKCFTLRFHCCLNCCLISGDIAFTPALREVPSVHVYYPSRSLKSSLRPPSGEVQALLTLLPTPKEDTIFKEET